MNPVRIWIVTLFPEYFQPLLQCGIVGKFFQGERGPGQVELKLIQLRDFAQNKYKSVDDSPYGGGPGMVLRADILKQAIGEGIAKARGLSDDLATIKNHFHIIYPSPRGRLWNSDECKKLALNLSEKMKGASSPETDSPQYKDKELIFICGRYEGIDERFIKLYIDEQICVGDYILSGGELAVMTILDSTLRYVPGILGNEASPFEESFEGSLLEAPQYTRPPCFENEEVPSVLISGHHAKIKEFQDGERIRLTKLFRPDLIQKLKDNHS